MYFYGDREGDEVHFRWSTASEINNDYFTIQMSADAQEWQNILKVQGEGTTHWQVVYMAKFINPKKAYYRLFQTDLDGTTKQVAVTVVYGMDATNVRYFDLIGRETTADAPGPKLKQVNYQLAYRIYTPYK